MNSKLNAEVSNALSGYLETLYDTNKNLLKLCGEIDFYKYEYADKIILDIIREIPRLIPYDYDRKIKKNILDKNDGLLEYNEEIPYLYDQYLSLMGKHYSLLDDIRKIRNKYTHRMHGVKAVSHHSSMFIHHSFEFKIKHKEPMDNSEEQIISISVDSLIELITGLNELFSQIVHDIIEWADAQGKNSYAYYARMRRFDFKDFNEIYRSNLLEKISRIMYDF